MWLDRKKRMSLVCAVVMPDHLHFVAYLEASTLSSVMHSLKSFTANQINKLLGREGSVWEPQYFEKCLRDERSFTEAIRYCLRNPVVSGIVDSPGDYPFLFCRFEVEEEV
jgi:REP element-mobilizing transposase RayT